MIDTVFCQHPNPVQVYEYLKAVNEIFTPPISQYIDLCDYSEKIVANAYVIWAVQKQITVGMCAFYANCPPNAFLTSLSVVPAFQGHGIAKKLLHHLKLWCRENDYPYLSLEVYKTNAIATMLYKQSGFQVAQDRNEKWLMTCKCAEEKVQS